MAIRKISTPSIPGEIAAKSRVDMLHKWHGLDEPFTHP
jgi:hypothetical protein